MLVHLVPYRGPTQLWRPRTLKTARTSDRSSRTPTMSPPSAAGRSSRRTASPFCLRRAETNSSSPSTSTPLCTAAEYFRSKVRAVLTASCRWHANVASGERPRSASSATARFDDLDRRSSRSSGLCPMDTRCAARSWTNTLITMGSASARTTSRTTSSTSARQRRTGVSASARTSSATRASPSVDSAYVVSIILASATAGITTTSTGASASTRRLAVRRTLRGSGSRPSVSSSRSSAEVMGVTSVNGRTSLRLRRRRRLGSALRIPQGHPDRERSDAHVLPWSYSRSLRVLQE